MHAKPKNSCFTSRTSGQVIIFSSVQNKSSSNKQGCKKWSHIIPLRDPRQQKYQPRPEGAFGEPGKSALGTRFQKYFLTSLVPSRLSGSRNLFYFINERHRSQGERKGWRKREKREIQIQMTGNESVSLLP